MNKNSFYELDKTEKIILFTETATQKEMMPFAVEKDWWVVRTLEIIFKTSAAEHLVFKGGTSLSKSWDLIRQFSRNIDLVIIHQMPLHSMKLWNN